MRADRDLPERSVPFPDAFLFRSPRIARAASLYRFRRENSVNRTLLAFIAREQIAIADALLKCLARVFHANAGAFFFCSDAKTSSFSAQL